MAQKNAGAALKPVLYIHGTEDYLIEEAVADIKRRALTEGFESMNYSAYDAKTMDVSEVLSAAETMPAFSDYRVVLVREAGSLKADQQKVISLYVESPSPTTCLVLVAGTGKVNKTTAFYKLLSKKGFVRVCYRLKEGELLAWIKRRAGALGKTITREAAERLVAVAGDGLRDIDGELEKIVLYAADKGTIEVGDVEDAGLDCREETVFSLSDAIGAKDLDAAMRIYAKVSTETPVNVLGAVARQMRVLLKLKSLVRSGVPARALPPKLGVPPYHVDSYVRRSRRFTEPELKRAIFRLSEADLSLKTGRIPPGLVMTSLIIDLCGSR
jgi:DNA polymerase-3 subunit delta